MDVTKEQVRHLGWLSRLDLSEQELERYAGQIQEIIKYLDKLDSIELTEAKAISIEKNVSELAMMTQWSLTAIHLAPVTERTDM